MLMYCIQSYNLVSHRLHDWGKTEYKIVRNWTPREVKAPQTDHAYQPSDNEDIDDNSPVRLNSFRGNTGQRNISRHSHSNRVPSDNESNGKSNDSVIDDVPESLSDVQNESIPQAGHIGKSIPAEIHSTRTKSRSTRHSTTTGASRRDVSIDRDHNTVIKHLSPEPSESLQSRRVLKTRQSVVTNSRSKSRNQMLSNSKTAPASSTSVESDVGSEEFESGGEENVQLSTTLSEEEERSQVSSQDEAVPDKENGIEGDMEEREGKRCSELPLIPSP